MVILYGLLRTFAAALRLASSVRHNRAQNRYERAELAFTELENDSKCHEVRVGEPGGYAAQLRLLKAFERKENARRRWIAAAGRLETRARFEKLLREFSGKKLPYSFGLIDMALVIHLMDRVGVTIPIDVNGISDLVKSWL